MPAKVKKGRVKTVDINKFNENVVDEDNLDWADDTWNQAGEEAGAAQGAQGADKGGKSYREFSRVDKNALGDKESFRTASQLTPTLDLSNLQPPYVAHFGNIRNNIHDETFLALFNKDVVVTHFLVKQESRTFGYVEFTTADAIRCALALNGSFVHGRKLFVDLATQKQIERLYNRGEQPQRSSGPVFSRENAGQAQPDGEGLMMSMHRGSMGGGAGAGAGGATLSRDAFGASQPDKDAASSNFGSNNNNNNNNNNTNHNGRFGGSGSPPNSPLSRSHMGAKMGSPTGITSAQTETHTRDDFSRDVIGSAVQPSLSNPPAAAAATNNATTGGAGAHGKFSGSGGGHAIASPLSASAGSGFANWRNEQPTAQPDFVDKSEDSRAANSSESKGHASNHRNTTHNNNKNDNNNNRSEDAHDVKEEGQEEATGTMSHASPPAQRPHNHNSTFVKGGGFRAMGGGGNHASHETGGVASLGNWRDEPRAEAAAPSSTTPSAAAPGGGGGGNNHRGGRGRGGAHSSMPPPPRENNAAQTERAARREDRPHGERVPHSSLGGGGRGRGGAGHNSNFPMSGGGGAGRGGRGRGAAVATTESSAGAPANSAERWASLRQ